ncbi:protein farnesyltransferase subunit beta-like isoform X2 [Cornus florida]|uniref:protein farnesyltransferase subunit beta-like isoform X2 n=1 Tax=Cornus florida TaxID=4283 RepID=UPI0028997320|nr:protein farnesyltransferase subunit beta-like isoform X2 [Cornus florida]
MSSSSPPRVTVTQREQWMTENQVFQMYQPFFNLPPKSQAVMLELQRDKHIEYLTNGLRQLSPAFSSLDANRPWLCYWIIHSIALLGESLDAELESNAIDFLNRCQDPDGGYGGGPGQLPHLATTYAAVNSLVTLGGDRALSSINRGKLYTFLLQMKHPSGGFRMHDGGEVDVRACYTAISAASILNILDYELVKDVGNYILSCQTYEGGIAGEPGSEAHGGYAFCGLATMILINEDWVVFRQGSEGGFQGRTNKLVDGCYSFWQGGVSALIQRSCFADEQLLLSDTEGACSTDSTQSVASDLSEGEQGLEGTSSHANETCCSRQEGEQNVSDPVNLFNIGFDFIKGRSKMEPLFNSIALQQYILLCSQLDNGGFRDKPGKNRDYYHTCYCLSGLAVCQYSSSKDADSPPLPRTVMGPYSNLLEPIHPLFNVVLDRFYEAHEFFSRP